MKNFFKKIKNLWNKIVDGAEDNMPFTITLVLYIVLVEVFKTLCFTSWTPVGEILSGFTGYFLALGTGLILGFGALVILLIFAGWFMLMRGLIMADKLGLY